MNKELVTSVSLIVLLVSLIGVASVLGLSVKEESEDLVKPATSVYSGETKLWFNPDDHKQTPYAYSGMIYNCECVKPQCMISAVANNGVLLR